MKKLLKLFIFVVILPHYVYCQEIPVQTTWIKKDDYGRPYDTRVPKERYKTNSNGNIHGVYILYDEDGKRIIEKSNYNDGVKQGKYYRDFNLFVVEANFVNGKFDGVAKTKYLLTGWVEHTPWKNGIKQGEYIKYDKDGRTVLEKGNYVNDLKEGQWTEYLPEEDFTQSSSPYNSGGYSKLGNTGNYLQVSGEYIQGKRNGVWTNITASSALKKKIEHAKWLGNLLDYDKEDVEKYDELINLQQNVYFAVKPDCFSIWDNGKFVGEYAEYPTEEYLNNLKKLEKEKEEKQKKEENDKWEEYNEWLTQHLKDRDLFNVKTVEFNTIYFNGKLNLSLSADENAKLNLQYPKGKLISLCFYSVIRYEFLNVLGTDENNKIIAAKGVHYYNTKLAAGEGVTDYNVSKNYRELQDKRIKIAISLIERILEIANNDAELKSFEKKLKKQKSTVIGELPYQRLFNFLGITL